MTKKTITKPKTNGTLAQASAPEVESKKTIFKLKEQPVLKTKEYELLRAGGIIFMMKAGPVSVYDEETNSIRSIRYIPQENSIWVNEQSAKPTKEPILFNSGRLFVRKDQPNLQRFLDMHPSNEANGGNVFRHVNLQENAKKDLQSEFEIVDALNLLRTKPLDELLAVATALGINTDNPADEIKHDLMVKAKKNPRGFVEAFDNPAIETKAKIRKAMNMSIIKHEKGHVKWTDTNKHILAVAEGKDAVDVFTRYCMTENGSVVLDEIVRQL